MTTTRKLHVPTFTLGAEITAEQEAFFDTYGFIRFGGVASADEVEMLRAELKGVEARFVAEKRQKAFGIPIKYGEEDGRPFVNRFAFTSQFSPRLQQFVRDRRFEPVRRLAGEDARLAELEKDGVVVNHWLHKAGSNYKNLGWHTDGLRDVFYLRMPEKMLNVGMYLDDSMEAKGGVRILPGTHKQGLGGLLFRKLYFLDNKPDSDEICLEAKAGDLTIHDGRLWHRVARATLTGDASRRRTMYMPFIRGPYMPKTETSATPLYHRLQRLVG